MKGDKNMADEVSIKVSLKAYQELVLKKIETGIPITRQIDDLVLPKKERKHGRKQTN
jgi:hypothetical protein